MQMCNMCVCVHECVWQRLLNDKIILYVMFIFCFLGLKNAVCGICLFFCNLTHMDTNIYV